MFYSLYVLYYRYIYEMAESIGERIPEKQFVDMMIEKATIIRDHLTCKQDTCPVIIVASIGPTMAVFKFYDVTKEDDSLKLHMTLSNLGDIDEQICILWQDANFMWWEYCSQCGKHDIGEDTNSN